VKQKSRKMKFYLKKSKKNEPCLPHKLRLELANRVSDLFIEVYDEPFCEKPTETEEEFKDLLISLSQISPPYEHLANFYLKLYNHFKEQKKENARRFSFI